MHYVQATESAGDGASTMALKPLGRGNQSPKQKVPVAPQNGDIVTAKYFFKTTGQSDEALKVHISICH